MMLLLFHVLYTLISPYVGYHAREREYGSLPGMIGVAAEMRCVGVQATPVCWRTRLSSGNESRGLRECYMSNVVCMGFERHLVPLII